MFCTRAFLFAVMAGLVPAIHVFAIFKEGADARHIRREDAVLNGLCPGMTVMA